MRLVVIKDFLFVAACVTKFRLLLSCDKETPSNKANVYYYYYNWVAFARYSLESPHPSVYPAKW